MVKISRRGFIMVLSSPSGAGKTTLTRRLLELDPSLSMSVSVTTRARRPTEIDGVHYHFIEKADFRHMVESGDLLEHADVFGNSYGTPRKLVEAVLSRGDDVISDLDWQGTQQLKARVRDDVVSVFILPPSIDELARRLTERNQDSPETVRLRMAKALDEMSHWPEYDYVVVNRELDESVGILQSILRAERAKQRRQIGLFDFVKEISGR